jgi:hypothetical protein
MVKSIIYSNGLGQDMGFKTIFGSLNNYSYIYIITIKKQKQYGKGIFPFTRPIL